MKKYENYKDSGLEWLGMVPEHWEIMRLKSCSSIILGKMLMSIPPKGQEANYTLEKYLKSKNVGWLNLCLDDNDVEEMFFNETEKKLYKLREGDIVMNEGGDIGKVALWHDTGYDCYIQNSINKITSSNGVIPAFLTYYLYSVSMSGYFWSIVSQISIAHLTKEKLANTPIILPPLSEQRTIASYLDHKVRLIDALISEKEKMVEDLKAYRSSLITETVTKGLYKEVKMKDSGLEWLGMVPEHWEIMPIKYVLEQSNEGIKIGPFGSALTGKVSTEHPVRVYGQWNVVGKDFNAGKNFVTEETYHELSSYQISANDILISMMGTVGKCAIIPETAEKGIMDSHIVKVRLDKKKILPKYFYYIYDKDCSKVIIEQIQCNKRGSIMDGLNSSLIKNFVITLPPLSEQRTIASYLDHKVDQIDTSISEIEHQLSDLKSYKSSLITEAVTGKIDLRDCQTKKS